MKIKITFFSKHFFLGHASPLKSSKIKFYCNPTTELAARPPYTAVRNLPKMKQIPMFWDILQRAPSYMDTGFCSLEMMDLQTVWTSLDAPDWIE